MKLPFGKVDAARRRHSGDSREFNGAHEKEPFPCADIRLCDLRRADSREINPRYYGGRPASAGR